MSPPPDLRLLVASDRLELTPAVHRAIAQLSAVCHVDLTVARVDTGGDDAGTPAPIVFDPDAAPRRIQRLELEEPDAATAIAGLSRQYLFDLVMAPAAGTSWWRRARSFRSRLLTRSNVPLWTAGHAVTAMHFHRPLRTIACLLDFEVDPGPLLQRAAAFARRMQARLHVLAVLPPVDDGALATVLTSDTPLLPAAAARRIEQWCTGADRPVVDVAVDGLRRGLQRLASSSRPDVLFVEAERWGLSWPFGFSRTLDGIGCPVICVPGGAAPGGWSFELVGGLPPVAATVRPETATGLVTPWPAGGMASRAS